MWSPPWMIWLSLRHKLASKIHEFIGFFLLLLYHCVEKIRVRTLYSKRICDCGVITISWDALISVIVFPRSLRYLLYDYKDDDAENMDITFCVRDSVSLRKMANYLLYNVNNLWISMCLSNHRCTGMLRMWSWIPRKERNLWPALTSNVHLIWVKM